MDRGRRRIAPAAPNAADLLNGFKDLAQAQRLCGYGLVLISIEDRIIPTPLGSETGRSPALRMLF